MQNGLQAQQLAAVEAERDKYVQIYTSPDALLTQRNELNFNSPTLGPVLARANIHILCRLREQLKDAEARLSEVKEQTSKSMKRLRLELDQSRSTNASQKVRTYVLVHLTHCHVDVL